MAVVGLLTTPEPRASVAAQQPGAPPQIMVAAAIAAAPSSQIRLTIKVGPPEALPSNSFVRIRGLPPTVSLSDGHAIAPGSWAVPLFALPGLKATIPPGAPQRSGIVISLVAIDGALIAEARTVLVIGQPSTPAGQEGRPTEVAPTAHVVPQPPGTAPEANRPSPPLPVTTPQDKARAERMLARGEEYLASGNVAGARDFFERAADAGLAAAALRLAATYDPVELRRAKAQGIVADPAMARRWYERARELGATEAVERLARLGGT